LDHRHETKRDRKTVNEKQINHVADAIKGIKTKKKKTKKQNKTPKNGGQISPAHYRDSRVSKMRTHKVKQCQFLLSLLWRRKRQTNKPSPKKKLLFTSIGRETFIRQVDWIKKKKPRIDFF
jgi:hypothetical protein